MNTSQPDDVVEKEIRIAASPEVVFSFFTDPVKLLQWQGTEASLDPRPGGIYRVNVMANDIAVGEYVEVTPYSRIVIAFGWEAGPIPPGSTTVEISFIPDGDGTILRLVHRGLGGESALQHAEGWQHYLERLAIRASGGDPGPDPWRAGVQTQ